MSSPSTGSPVENTATSTNESGNSCGAVFVEVRVDARYGGSGSRVWSAPTTAVGAQPADRTQPVIAA